MKRLLKLLARNLSILLPLSVIESYLTLRYGYPLLHFSLNGEDIILQQLFKKRDGFYVDVGAHHPTHFSNTYLLYRRGWHGINIDATPGKIDAFKSARPHDINIECAVSASREPLAFFLFDKSALNTGSPTMAAEEERLGHPILQKVTVAGRPLADILNEYLPEGQHIDFMNIDVEGADMDVLTTNDWGRYAPSVIAIEDITFSPAHPEHSESYRFLTAKGYVVRAFMGTTLIFSRKD